MAQKRRFTRYPRFSRFRRKNRGTWFPVLGTNLVVSETEYHTVSFQGETPDVSDSLASGPTQNVWPLTRDITQFGSEPSTIDDGPSLRDVVEGQSWRLNRLVGQLHLDVTEQNVAISNVPWPLVQIAAGIFVARTGDFDETLPDLTFDEIDPFQFRNAMNPWVWRRTWVLSRPLASNVGFSAVPCSNNNMAAPSGPYIDTKVKRRILREHRLWFVIGTMGFDGQFLEHNVTTEAQPHVRYHLDLRIHGQMVRGKNTPTF